MKRNVVQQGPTTLMVSLPIKWVKKYNVLKGSQVEVREDGRNLIIETDAREEVKKKEVNLLHQHYYYVWTEMMAAYVSGYDEITVTNISKESLDFIEKEALRSMTGFDIVEQTPTYVIIKKILHEDSSEFDTIMRRIFIGLMEGSKNFFNFMKTGEGEEYIIPMERTNNRQTYYLKRLLTKEGFKNQDKTTFAAILVELLEGLMNQYKYCYWEIQRAKIKKIDSKTFEIFERIHEKLELNYKLYFNYSQELYQDIESNSIRINAESRDILEQLNKEPGVMHYLMDMIEKLRFVSYQIHGINS